MKGSEGDEGVGGWGEGGGIHRITRNQRGGRNCHQYSVFKTEDEGVRDNNGQSLQSRGEKKGE